MKNTSLLHIGGGWWVVVPTIWYFTQNEIFRKHQPLQLTNPPLEMNLEPQTTS